MNYCVIKGLSATEVNVHAGFYTSGFVAMTAVCGMAHAVGRTLASRLADEEGDSPVITGVVFSVSQCQEALGAAKRVNYTKAQQGNASKSASEAYDPVADLEFELVLELGGRSAGTNELEPVLEEALLLARLSGGPILWTGEFTMTSTREEAFKALHPEGFVVEDATAVLAADLEQQADVHEALLTRISRPRPNPDTGETPYAPRYVPLATGFHQLTGLSAKKMAKKGYLHTYVEPVVTLGLLRSVPSLRKRSQNFTLPVFWSHHAPTDGYYLVRAH